MYAGAQTRTAPDGYCRGVDCTRGSARARSRVRKLSNGDHMNDSIGSSTVPGGADELARRRLSRDERRRAEAEVPAERRVNEQLAMVSRELRNSLGALRI